MRLRLKTLRYPEQVLQEKREAREAREALMGKTVAPISSFADLAARREANPDGPPVRLNNEVQRALDAIQTIEGNLSVAGGPVVPDGTLRIEHISAGTSRELRGVHHLGMMIDDVSWFPGTTDSTATAPVITVVCCPDIPADEFERYEQLIQTGTVVLLPYEVWVYQIDLGRNQLITIDGASAEELQTFHEKLAEAIEERHFRVLVTHEVVVHQL